LVTQLGSTSTYGPDTKQSIVDRIFSMLDGKPDPVPRVIEGLDDNEALQIENGEGNGTEPLQVKKGGGNGTDQSKTPQSEVGSWWEAPDQQYVPSYLRPFT
jgi:hypothetical protein